MRSIERKKGNRTIKRSFTMGESFSLYNSMTRKKGWFWIERWGQEPYRSVWINPQKLSTFTYCEGDLIKVICDDRKAFLDELREANVFYKQYQ